MIHNSASGHCKPKVIVGLHGRIHLLLGPNAPSLVGSREEMRALGDQLIAACGVPERFIDGDLQSCNDDIHPREQRA